MDKNSEGYFLQVRSQPKAEMQWFKGTQKIKEGPKFAVKYNTLTNDEYEIMLEISVSKTQ